MKIQKLILYKTALDNQYSNVIDTDPETKLTKESFKEKILDAYYSPLQIYNGETKAIQESDGGCVVSISKEYEDIMNSDYNYAAIYTGSQWVFYFITSMSSLNDSNNPSMLIDLDRDAWSNNIEYLTNHNEDDKQQVVRCHQSRIYDGGNNLFYPYYVPSNDNSSFTSNTEETFLNIGSGGNAIWCGVRFSKDTIVSGGLGDALNATGAALTNAVSNLSWDDAKKKSVVDTVLSIIGTATASSGFTSILRALNLVVDKPEDLATITENLNYKTIRDTPSYSGCIMYESGAPVYYFPLAIINSISDGSPVLSLSFTCNYGANTFSYNFNSANTINALLNFESEEIIESFLTTIPPFTYTVNGNTISTEDNLYVTTNRLRNSSGTGIIFPYANSDDTFAYVIFNGTQNVYKNIPYTYKSPLYEFSATDSIGSVYFNPYEPYENVKTFEPRIYCAPFTRLFTSLGQVEIEIPIVQDRVNVSNILLYGNKSEPSLSVLLNGKMISSYNNVGTPGNLPTSYDKWKDFMLSSAINMGSSLLGHMPSPPTTSTSTTIKKREFNKGPTVTQKLLNADDKRIRTTYKHTPGTGTNTFTDTKTSVSGAGSFAGGAMMGLAGGIMNTTQQGVSIMGNATRATIPSVKGNNNIEHFVPKMIKETFTDIKEMNDILGELYLYGYKYPEVQSVKSNNRVWFDYCETSMCSLPMIKNYRDREILESAFDRGITKWHYGPYGLQHNFLRNLNNVERKYISPIDAQYYFDFTKDDGTGMENRGTLGNVNVNWNQSYTQNSNGLSTNGSTSGGVNFTMVESADTIGYGNTYTIAIKLGAKTITTTQTAANRKGILKQSRYRDHDPAYAIVSYDETNDTFSFCGHSTALTWSDVQGKTITVSYYNAGGSTYGCFVSAFLDGEPIFQNLNWGAISHKYMKYIDFFPYYTGGYVEKFAMWLDGAGNHVWDATKASQHLI